MNVAIIYGTMRKGNTYNCVELLLKNLALNLNIKATEIFLPKDLPNFYNEYLTCLPNNKNIYSHLNNLNNIIKSLNESDLIILACPVFSCDITTEMKAFSDYLSNKYLQNKLESVMHNKIGLVMSTATGAGLFHSIRTLKRTLNSLGISKTFTFSKNLYEMNWEHVTLKNKMGINKKLFKLSNKIVIRYSNSHPIKAKLNQHPYKVIEVDFNHLQNPSYLKSKNL